MPDLAAVSAENSRIAVFCKNGFQFQNCIFLQKWILIPELQELEKSHFYIYINVNYSKKYISGG